MTGTSARGLRVRVAATVLGVAVAGFALGYVVGRSSAPPGPDVSRDRRSTGTPAVVFQALPSDSLLLQLRLSDAQRARIDSVVTHAQRRLDSLSAPLVDELRDAVADAHTGVRAALDSVQLARFDSLLATLPVIRRGRRGG